MSNSYGNKSRGYGPAYAVLSTLPIGQPITVVMEDVLLEGTWSGFAAGNATIILPGETSSVYIALDKIQSITIR
ncbi:hypothetical protein [Paenibacillus glycanilyticus]|uniref:Uncharacterized protein n=1 Tax=Paenibacillus glycanilyticus TaxID=126569 RepID=A0ABQ6GEX4_9BACL|nr:hypothetical protein [Paenibacillus glycanilyticus]GLX68635.1 hypothetical protein MU1_29800 [Paenibacillus glycanilyticus]